MNEAMFDLPEEGRFVDRTVTYLAGSSPGGVDLVVLVERRPIAADESLLSAVAEHARDALTRFRGYKVISEQEIQIASQPAIDVRARWRHDGGEPIYTRRVHLVLRPTWLIFTCETPLDEADVGDRYLEHALASLRLRE